MWAGGTLRRRCLLLKGNAVVVEWLTSPIIYGADDAFRSELLALAHRTRR